MSLAAMMAARRLELAALGQSGPWLAVFDIDSTIMDTGPRNQAILERAVHELPSLAGLGGAVPQLGAHWNLADALRGQPGFDDPALADVQAYWAERFFTDDWLVHDLPYPGVGDCLLGLKEQGFRLVYLTGRHRDGMAAGTLRSFAAHGLPAGPEELFRFKPHFEDADLAFKAEACRDLARLGTVVATVDNEPANVNRFIQAFPLARHFWLRTVSSPDPEPLDAAAIAVTPADFL
jgi:beta-phosphoglucomutase-like phosphatase (HAD superfamily)